MNQTFFKRAPSCYKLPVMFLKNKCSFCDAFNFVYGEYCMLLSDVCFFLFVYVMFSD
jgi:hypothetical protein